MNNRFYVPINSNSLAHYFNKGIILPSRYFTNKPEDIIQDRYRNLILVSNAKWVKESDCSLEIILTNSEVESLNKKSDTFSLLNTPLPISRIKSICFIDKEQKETTIWNINNGSAFIPNHIIDVEPNKNIEININELPFDEPSSQASDIDAKIKRFDVLLGGFAFMRLGGKSFMNYSYNYFATLSYFNKSIEEQITKIEKETRVRFSHKYTGIFFSTESEWTKWQQYIYKNVDLKDVESIAQKDQLKIDYKFGLIQIESLSPLTHLFEIAILATYGEGKNKSTDNLVSDLRNGKIPDEKIEDVAIVFGLNNGYSKLRNQYKSQDSNNIVKFQLESKLDYYTIESIYQWVFNSNRNNSSFSYIDNWCPISKEGKTFGMESYQIFDVSIVYKKKQTSLEVFLETYSKDVYSSIIKSIESWLPPFAKTDEQEALLFIEKKLKPSLSNSVLLLQKDIERELTVKFKSEQGISFEDEKKNLTDEIQRLRSEIEHLRSGGSNYKTSAQEIDKTQSGDMIIKEELIIKKDDQYDSMTFPQLKKVAKEKGIKVPSKIKDSDLIKLIRSNISLL